MERISLSISEELKKEASKVAKELGLSRGSLMRLALTSYLKNHKK